jgi:hypothetical protein
MRAQITSGQLKTGTRLISEVVFGEAGDQPVEHWS